MSVSIWVLFLPLLLFYSLLLTFLHIFFATYVLKLYNHCQSWMLTLFSMTLFCFEGSFFFSFNHTLSKTSNLKVPYITTSLYLPKNVCIGNGSTNSVFKWVFSFFISTNYQIISTWLAVYSNQIFSKTAIKIIDCIFCCNYIIFHMLMVDD